MLDLTFSYDFQVILNEGVSIGVLHSFNPNMFSSRFKDIDFQMKKKRLGSRYINFRIV